MKAEISLRSRIMQTIPFKPTERLMPLKDIVPRQTYPMQIIKKARMLAL